MSWFRPSLPVVPHYAVALGPDERRTARRVAARVIAGEPTLGATEPFGPALSAGLAPGPALVIEDHSAIRLFETCGNLSYGYRALLLAGDDDLVAIGESRCAAFESYCRDLLGLGRVTVLRPRATNPALPLALRCARDEVMMRRLVEAAQRHRGLNVIPYMGTGQVWRLAGEIAARSRQPVRVGAPPARLTRRVNDKLWFSERVAELLGPRARPPSYAGFGLAALAAKVAFLSKRSPAVAVKLTDSASSAGNIVLDGREVAAMSLREIRFRLHRLLRGVGWRPGYPLMLTAWEQPIIASPSVQLWIPRRDEGDLIVEGIFDQTVSGLARAFNGVQPTALRPSSQRNLAAEAASLGLLFQELGYYGRCSFDAILVGDDEASAVIHWVECNGRWGGTSIPMTLANRLVGDWERRPFVVVEQDHLDGSPIAAGTLLEELKDDLYRPGQSRCGAVLLSPGQIESGAGYEFMVLGRTLETARNRAARLAARLEARMSHDRPEVSI